MDEKMKNLLGICLGALVCFTILFLAVILEKQYEQICEFCAACNFTCNFTGEISGSCAELKEFCGNFTKEVHSVYTLIDNPKWGSQILFVLAVFAFVTFLVSFIGSRIGGDEVCVRKISEKR